MLRRLNPRQKKILLALLAGGGLALIALLGRRGGTAAAPAATAADVGATPTSGLPTFADNGGMASGLSTDVTSQLGLVAQALDELPGAVGAVIADNTQPIEQTPTITPDQISSAVAAGVTAGFAGYSPVAQAATPSGVQNSAAKKAATSAKKTTTAAVAHPATKAQAAAQAKEDAKPNVSVQDSGSRSGLASQGVVKNGKFYRFYESRPGKGDWGAGGKVYVREAGYRSGSG